MIFRLKRTPGIYLVGFMGSGKSTVGQLLANRIGWTFFDLDSEIEASQKSSIAEIFETRGEAEFRRLESEAIRARVRRIECGIPAVVALGGGAFVQPDVYALLMGNGVSIWLDCPFDLIQNRVARNGVRPLARDPVAFEQLYNDRRKYYGLADFRIEVTEDDPGRTVESVLELSLFQ
ncbi:MAG: shikimate kinase [Acidobacteriota bacterium]|nr:shikimate kinase [Acidobacteriota bacterium]